MAEPPHAPSRPEPAPMVLPPDPPVWFLLHPGQPGPWVGKLAEAWRRLGLGQAIVLADGMVPVRVTSAGMEMPDQVVPLTDEQFDRLLDAIGARPVDTDE